MSDQMDEQEKRDLRLLRRMLLVPLPRKTLGGKVRAFLGDGIWQGIGGVTGIISLFITIFLTFYIYFLTQNQQNANIRYNVTSFTTLGQRSYTDISIYNNGPKTAINPDISVTAIVPIDCKLYSNGIDDKFGVTVVQNSLRSCIIHTNQIYSGDYIDLTIFNPVGDKAIVSDNIRVQIRGIDVVVTEYSHFDY